MPLHMDDAYVKAKSRQLDESYATVEKQLIVAFGAKKAATMIKGLFPGVTVKRDEPRKASRHMRAARG